MNIKVSIRGIRPLIMHNGQTADPLNAYAKALKKMTAKRGKTDEDYGELAAVEFEASLYWSDEIGLHLPTDNFQSMLVAGAKRVKLGRQIAAAQVNHPIGFPLVTEGHTSLAAIKSNHRLRFSKLCNVNNRRILRTRCMIPTGWTCDFNIDLDTEGMDADQLEEILHLCGAKVGLGDWRPGAPKVPGTFGKFVVEKFTAEK